MLRYANEGAVFVSSVNKAIRFSKREWQLIEKFLDQNPFFDFSSLGRVAISSFIKNPTLKVSPVSDAPTPKQKIKSKIQEISAHE